MAKLTRKFVRATLDGEGTTDEKLEAIMTAFGASTSGMIDKEELETEKNKAIDDALKKQPKDYKETQEWKDMVEKIGQYEKKDAIRNLRDKGVKNDKYAEMLLGRIDAEKDIDEQLKEMREEYVDMFATEEEPNKPQFGASTQGQMPKGNDGQSFGDAWGFVPKNK